ncbi:MAG: ATP-binding protein [Chthoniobacteraceae bacterium]
MESFGIRLLIGSVTNEIAPTSIPSLRGWALELARRWNAGVQSLFVVHGNIFDLFPVPVGGTDTCAFYAPLKSFLTRRLFPDRGSILFYDVADGLSFGSPDMQRRFFDWLEVFDAVEKTSFHISGPPRDFNQLAPLLRRFFQRTADDPKAPSGLTLIIDFPEKMIPAAEEAHAGRDERMTLVTLLKLAASEDVRQLDVGILLVTESAADLHSDVLRNPHVGQVRIELPDAEERAQFLAGELDPATSDLPLPQLVERTAGLNLLRIRQLIAEAVENGRRVTGEHVTAAKKRLIEEYCQGLVRFRDPKPGVTLDLVATHEAAKAKLRELAWLIREGKTDVLERGILVPGRVGVGKSFLIGCFASECGLPVMELGEFRSKWVGDTERQQARILSTVRALGPVIVVVDEADAVFGNRGDGADSGVGGRVFAAFAAHLGDASLRGRELWVAMTSRPDLLAIDMKRQGRFGLSLPLFPAQSPEDVVRLFEVIAGSKRVHLTGPLLDFVRTNLGDRPLTGSDVEAIVMRAKERAVLARRDDDVQLEDLSSAVESFIDPLDADLLRLQELAAILSCSDRRYLPEPLRERDRGELAQEFKRLRGRLG